MIIVVQDPDGQTTSNKVVDQVPDNNTVSGYEIPNEKTTSDYESSMAAPQPDQESEDQEVVVSSASIQWEIDMKKKLSTESYQEDFIEEDLNTKRS
jgi:PIN domain nuclease of toxin-antitoxin system